MLCLLLIDGSGNSLHGRKQPITTRCGWHFESATLNPDKPAAQPPKPLLSNGVIFWPESCQATRPGATELPAPGDHEPL
jgi:hypothetical protein